MSPSAVPVTAVGEPAFVGSRRPWLFPWLITTRRPKVVSSLMVSAPAVSIVRFALSVDPSVRSVPSEESVSKFVVSLSAPNCKSPPEV